jgi:hypothetical protein
MAGCGLDAVLLLCRSGEATGGGDRPGKSGEQSENG